MTPLNYGTLRHALYKRIGLAANVGAQLGADTTSQQAVDLLAGRSVTFGAEQLASFFPLGQVQHPSLPAAYTAPSYTLTGGDTLTANP